MTNDSEIDKRCKDIGLVNAEFNLKLFDKEIKKLASGNTISLEVERLSKIHSAFMTGKCSGKGVVELLDSASGNEAMEVGTLSFAPQERPSVKFCYQLPERLCCFNVNLITLKPDYPL